MPGWLKIHRKISRSDMWTSEKFTRGQAWVDLLMRTSFHDGFVRVRGIRIDYTRGQYCASMKGLADRWKWSQGKVKRFLEELHNDEQIEYQNSGVTTLITITNYDQYQQDGEQTGEQTGSKRGANGEQTVSKRRHSKKEEEGKEGKDDNPPSGNPNSPPRKKASSLPIDFEVTDAHKAWADEKDFLMTEDMLDNFKDHHRSKGTKMVDWNAAWRTWVRNDSKWNGLKSKRKNSENKSQTNLTDYERALQKQGMKIC